MKPAARRRATARLQRVARTGARRGERWSDAEQQSGDHGDGDTPGQDGLLDANVLEIIPTAWHCGAYTVQHQIRKPDSHRASEESEQGAFG